METETTAVLDESESETGPWEWDVILTKSYTARGVMKVMAFSDQEAMDQVEAMKRDFLNPLQTNDPRIEWSAPEYVDYSFEVESAE